MSTTDLAKKINAVAIRQISVGALTNYLRPRLAKSAIAMDSKPLGIMAKVFDGVTGAKFASMKPQIATRIRDLTKGKLAADASLEDVEKVLDMLDGHEIDGGDESVSEPQHNAMEAAAHGSSTLGIPEKVGKEFVSKDAGAEEMRGFLKSKNMADDDIEHVMSKFPKPATDEDPEEKKKREAEEKEKADKEAKDKAAKDAEMKDMVTKPAMDEAIKTAVTSAVSAERANSRATFDALQKVRPIVGALEMAFDSASAVFRHVLKMKGVPNVDKLHESALEPIVDMQATTSTARHEPTHIAMDAASTKDFASRFPDAGRIGSAT